MLEIVLSDQVIVFLAGLLATALTYLVRAIFKDRADARLKLFYTAVDVAYNAVNDIAARTPTKIDDKVALALRVLRDYLATHQVQPTLTELERAKLLFAAMHGEGR